MWCFCFDAHRWGQKSDLSGNMIFKEALSDAFFLSHSQGNYIFNLTDFIAESVSIFIMLSQTALVLWIMI